MICPCVPLRVKLLAAAMSLVGASLAIPAHAAGQQAQAGPASEPTVRLLSQSQYINTITAIFGSDIALKVRFAPVRRTAGLLGVGASSAVLTSGGLDPLEAAARSVAEQVVSPGRRPFLVHCIPAHEKARDDVCARKFLAATGRLLYRRPLEPEELESSVQTAGQAVGPAGDFYFGLATALSRMLISPDFLFVRERVEADPKVPDTWRLDAYSKASRLSFLLWDAAPDDALLVAAARGDLHKPAGLRREFERMIASPLHRDGVRAFFSDFFVMEGFDTLAKDSTIYPGFTLKAIEESREQLLRMVVDHLLDRQGDYRDLYTTRRTFIAAELAPLYRLPLDVGPLGWVPYEFKGDDPRAGVLTQIGFLAQYAHPGRNSATKRGRAIREVLLCQKVPDPPGNVDFSKFEDPKNPLATARERLAVHRENPVCAGCHRLTDPIGLAFEHFDGGGQYRETENGARIDAGGTLDGIPFNDAAGLGEALRNSPALKSCIVKRLYAYSRGRATQAEDELLLQRYQAIFDRSGYRIDVMLWTLIADPSFFAARATAAPEAVPVKTASLGDSHVD
jgi:Protein of unknown function (DUF1588)/Protein of unknown function (DUF1592)/Protein of unknown function (DUF1595)/Protein of unknown function (DUF1585)